MKNTLETRLGLFFALAVVAAFLIFELAGGADWFRGGYRVHGLFHHIQDLKEGDPVKMAGVRVGQVDKIQLGENRVRVTLKLHPDAVVRTDSVARIKFTGLMGQNYVAVDFGSPDAPALAPDATLETREQPDFSALMAKLDNVATGVENVAKTFSGDSLQNVLGPLTDFMQENNPRISAVLGNMQDISSQIAEGKGTVGKMIMDDALYNSTLSAVDNLNSTADEIKLTLDDAKGLFGDAKTALGDAQGALSEARSVMAGINEGQGTLGRLAKDEKLYDETTTAMTNLKEIFEKINQGQGFAGKLVNDEALYKNVRMTLQKLDKATEGLEDTGPLSILGTAVNSLF